MERFQLVWEQIPKSGEYMTGLNLSLSLYIAPLQTHNTQLKHPQFYIVLDDYLFCMLILLVNFVEGIA